MEGIVSQDLKIVVFHIIRVLFFFLQKSLIFVLRLFLCKFFAQFLVPGISYPVIPVIFF